jgi:hypothetical protein
MRHIQSPAVVTIYALVGFSRLSCAAFIMVWSAREVRAAIRDEGDGLRPAQNVLSRKGDPLHVSFSKLVHHAFSILRFERRLR